jgi:uncharacterized phage infection (PIP) family protein YhgE
MMAFPGSGFQYPPGPASSSIPCGGCIHYLTIATNLQSHVSHLESKALTLQADKAQIEEVMRYLLRLNASHTMVHDGENDSNRYVLRLSKKIVKAEAQKECLQSMLERALKIICQLSLPSVERKSLNSDGPLIDLNDAGLMDSPVSDDLLTTTISPESDLEQRDDDESDDSSTGTLRQSEVVLKECGSDHFPEAPHYEPATSVARAEHSDRIPSAVSQIRVH